MAFDSLARRRIGTTALAVPLLGMGCVQIGGWPNRISAEDAHATLAGAWDAGIRLFDTAPLYGLGMSETRLGAFLRTQERDSYVVATKVGRLVVEAPDRPAHVEAVPFWKDAPPKDTVFDFSYDGVMRSIEESLERLGVGRIDIAHIHDPDDHADEALSGAYRALAKLRAEGTIRGVGVGMNFTDVLARFARAGDFDCFLLAGRYTVLDHASLADLMPLCVERNVSIIIGGVYNSGALIAPSPRAFFDYNRMDETWREKALARGVRRIAGHETGPYWLDRALRIKAASERHGVPLQAVALQFSAAHPAVASIVVGTEKAAHIRQAAELLAVEIPAALWIDLKVEGLVAADAPTP